MALNPVDKLLAGYLGFVTLLILARDPFSDAGVWLLVMHALFVTMLFLFTRMREADRVGQALHTLYPIAMLLPLYAEIGFLNEQLGTEAVLRNDAVIQALEETLFGAQVSFTWIREFPSIFWSGFFHLAYFSYYPIVTVAPVVLVLRGRHRHAQSVLFATLLAFVICYVVFVLYPVGGPYYAFEHPTGPAREVWSARVVYWLLAGGSSFGAAFPSSHVAATVAATGTLWIVWRPLGAAFVLPALFLTIGTVYCQMHYGIDAAVGAIVGIGATVVVAKRASTLGVVANREGLYQEGHPTQAGWPSELSDSE